MLRYELKRIIRSKIFIILMLLTLVYFSYLTISYLGNNNESIDFYKQSANETNDFCAELMKEYTGDVALRQWFQTILAEKEETMKVANEKFFAENEKYAQEHNGEYPPFDDELSEITNDYFLTLAAYNMFDYQFNEYPQTIKATLQKAIALVNDGTQDSYTIRENQKAIEKYNTKKDFTLIDSKPAEIWYEMYTTYYEYFYIFLAFVFIILAADVFCFENSHSMEGIVFSTKNGRNKLFISKLMSLFIFAFITMLIFTCADIGIAYYIMDENLLFEPIQAIKTYQMSTSNINFLELIVYGDLLRFALLGFVICLAASVCQISRKVFVSAVLDIIVLFSMFATFIYASSYIVADTSNSDIKVFDSGKFAMYEKLRIFLPACLSSPHTYFEKFDYINIAGCPFTRMTICLAITIVTAILFILFAHFRFGKVLKFIPHKTKAKGVK